MISVSEVNIGNMDLKQLRNEVQELRDELARMKRLYEDMLYNLDFDNFSSKTADIINSKVSEGKMQSIITQTANEIETSVKNELKGFAKTTWTEDMIRSAVSKIDLSTYSTIEETANAIISTVVKHITEYFELKSIPTKNNTTDVQKTMLCRYNNKYYYWDSTAADPEWKEYTGDGLKTLFVQTANGFSLTGNVKISGDLITEGTIAAERITTDDLACTKLYSKGSDAYYFKMISNVGDIGIFKKSADENGYANNENCVWGVYHSDPATGAVNFYSCGTNYMGFNKDVGKIFPKGAWDFTNCTVTGLNVSGVTAVFG